MAVTESDLDPKVWKMPIYTRRQINLYRMFFADFSVNFQSFWWNFARTIYVSRGDYCKIFMKKYYVVQKLDHLTCSKLEITTSL